ncbi:MAG: DNA-binding response regulator, partial [Acidobacteriales bacterium]
AGGKYITPTLAEKLALEVGPGGDRDPHEILSDREFQVLRLIGSGRTATEIAQQLALSPKTVATYRTRILEKMRLKTTAQLVRYAIEHGMT